jgi:hypothetical protein
MLPCIRNLGSSRRPALYPGRNRPVPFAARNQSGRCGKENRPAPALYGTRSTSRSQSLTDHDTLAHPEAWVEVQEQIEF